MNSVKKKYYKDYRSDESIGVPRRTSSRWKHADGKSRKSIANDGITPVSENESQCYSKQDIDDLHNGELLNVRSFHSQVLAEFKCHAYEAFNDPALEEVNSKNNLREEPCRVSDADDDDSEDDDRGFSDTIKDSTDDQETTSKLYQGASITVAASILLIMAFALKHCLTGEALADLLLLIEAHCLSPNQCRKTVTMFTEYFKSVRAPLEYHYFCSNCHCYFGLVQTAQCSECDKNTQNDVAYFIVIPIVQQLTTLFQDRSVLEEIRLYKQKVSSKSPDADISDVTDGQLYKERFERNGYFRGEAVKNGEVHLSLQINTDGVSLFLSSNFSIWPVYFVINELPPSMRFTRKFRIFGGLWFGYSKPDFRVFLRPFAESLHDLYQTGFSCGELKIRGLLLNGVFDAPARCLFQNLVQFNGFYGCPYCLTPGETVKTSERGHTHAYPFNRDSPDGCGDKRTHAMFEEFGKEAEDNRKNGKTANKFGVRGLSWFLYVPKFDIVRGVAVDYMHCIMLGIVKMLLSLWFDKSYRNESFYISDKLTDVNERLMKIKPPNFIGRMPRPLTDLAHYKATEFKTFLLYYSLPCLWGLLSDELFAHYMLLVQISQTLLSDKISLDQIEQCRKMAMHFCINLSVFYGPRYMTSNVHLLLHIPDRVLDLGPLWANSCFYFEDFNGQLRNLFHGTQNIDKQIAFAVCIHQSLPQLSSSLTYGTPEHELFTKLMGKRIPVRKDMIGSDIYIVGAMHCDRLSETEKHAVFSTGVGIKTVSTFKRALIRGTIVHSQGYKAVSKRNSCVIKYGASFGLIQKFVKTQSECICKSTDCSSQCQCESKHYALVNQLLVLPIQFPTDPISSCSVNHVTAVSNPSDKIEAVLVKDIDALCVLIESIKDVCFVAWPANSIEKE